MADDMQGESGLNTSEDDFEIVNDGNKNMQPRIDVEGGRRTSRSTLPGHHLWLID